MFLNNSLSAVPVVAVWLFKMLSACVAMLKWPPKPILSIFVSWINSAALRVMGVRNHGRCHGDATLQYSFAARPPACLPMLAAASELGRMAEVGGEGRGDERRD